MSNGETTGTLNAFWPLCLVALSLLVMLTTTLGGAVRDRNGINRAREQQQAQFVQASQTEAALRAVLADLLELAKQDSEADRIVKKYKIVFNGPVSPAASASISTPIAPASGGGIR
jgi:hypothetical protein